MSHGADLKSDAAPLRDLALFVAGPVLMTLAIATAFALHPWPVPTEGQVKAMTPAFYGPVLALGALGVWLSSRAGFASAPSFTDGRAWRALLFVSIAFGIFFGATVVASDVFVGTERIAAEAMGQTTINVAFPASIAHYTFGAIVSECMLRWGPLAILVWLFGTVLLRGRHQRTVFWIFATLASLIEPVGQTLMMVGGHVALTGQQSLALASLGVIAFAGNLMGAELFRRYGWPAPLVERLALYAVWHVIWPLMS